MMSRIQQRCPMCQARPRLAVGSATWSCACGVTYAAYADADGTISVSWLQNGRGDLLFATRAEVMFPRHSRAILAKRGRPAKKPASDV